MERNSLLGRVRGAARAIGKIRPPRGRRGRVLAVLALVLLVGVGAGGFWWSRAGDLPDNAVFKNGDQLMTVDQLQDRIQTLRALYGVQPPDPQDAGKLDGFHRDTAKAVAVSMVLDKAAQERGIVIADKSAQDVLTKFISRQLGEGPEARGRFIQALGSAGTSEGAVLGEIRRQLSMSQLFDTITRGTSVSDAEVADAFGNRKAQLDTPERRQVGNIVVNSKETADQVLSELGNGVPFETLAAQRSLDGATRDKGGDLGAVRADQLEDAYAKAAFAVRPGESFGPVQTEHGWNVGRIFAVLPPEPASFDRVKDTLKQQLQLEKALAKWRGWLGEQLAGAQVEYAEAYRPADPDAPAAQAPGWSPAPAPAPAPEQPRPPR